ncbi:unnamed protein product [Bursaphelenchus okinawaensis]|uniref:Uncharacterized protein n=1 Tax=Bursaphelenchus okinawaensis TaxID=465554 RepID=A0A811KS92_9BILA|nr:unnamed protein product [Bursaphelenchus okinawaensis]CAG9111048.1 unnamed protein product [Bursaphelenchus okinawaensis]
MDIKWHYAAMFVMTIAVNAIMCTLLTEFVFRYMLICKGYTLTNWNIVLMILSSIIVLTLSTGHDVKAMKEITEKMTEQQINAIFDKSVWRISGQSMKSMLLQKVRFCIII